MKGVFRLCFNIIFLSAFLIFSAVSCGDNVSDSETDKVSVRLKMDGLFEDAGRSKRTSVGGHTVSSLYLDVSASGWSGLRLNLTDMLNRNENEVDVEITAGKIYTFAVSAYTSGNVLLCSGSESAMIRANSEVNINLVCALQISVDLSSAKVEGVMNFLDYQSLPSVQTVMQNLTDAIDDGVNLSEVQDAVEEAELAAGSSVRSKNSQSYRNLVAGLKALKQSSAAAFNAFKSMVNALDNTAELKEAASILESVLEEGLKPEISVSPPSVSFGDVAVNTFSPEETVLITNSGNYRLNISSVMSSNNYSFMADMSGGSSPCGSTPFTLVPQASCTVTVKAHPVTAGILNGTLSIISSDASVDSASAALTVNGTVTAAPVITADTSKLDFGAVATGHFLTKNVTLTNGGTTPATGITASFTGGNGYTETTGCTSLSAGQSCTITVRFEPASPAGLRDSVMTISSNAADVSVELRGYAVVDGTMASEVLFEDTGFNSITEKSIAVCGGGKAHAVFSSNGKLTYGFYDGSAWMLSNMGAEPDEWDKAVITADSDCMPHVAYTKDQTLHYAQSRTSGFWQHYEVDPSMTLRMDGALSIAADGTDIYISSIAEGTDSVVVDKTADFGATFTRRTVESGLAGPESTMLKIDSAGVIHIVYKDSDGIHYADSTSDPWAVDEEIADGYNPSIAFSGSEVHVIYHNGGLYEVVKSDIAGWTSVPIEIDNTPMNGLAALSIPGGIEVYYKYTDTHKIMKSTYDGTWSAPAELYDNVIPFFTGSAMIAASAASNGDRIVVYDEKAVLSSKSCTGGTWGNSVPVQMLLGINSALSFDVEFVPEGADFSGVLGDFLYDTSGGLYIFRMESGGVSAEVLDTPEKYIVKGVDFLNTGSGESVCYVYETGVSRKLGYFDGDTYASHAAMDDSTSKTCALEKDDTGGIYIAYGDSASKPALRKIGTGVSGGLNADVSETGMSMRFLPSENKLYFVYYDVSNDYYGFNYFSNTNGLTVESVSHESAYADLAVSSSGSLVYLFGGSDAAGNSTVMLAECEADLSSCDTEEIYSPAAGNYVDGVSLAVDSSDHIYAGIIESGEKVVLVEGVLGDTYTVHTLESSDNVSSGSYDGIKVLTDPVTGLVSVFYRSGSKLLHETESLIPVLSLSHVYKNFGRITMGTNSAELAITLANSGTQMMSVEDISLEHGDSFILETEYGAGSCPQDQFSLYPGESCSVKVKFRPLASGAFGDRLVVETDRSTEMTSLFGVGQ
ncbi:choice-of-anchor D domain-containing protein [Geovibrio thiophilus]|nr:choice-of-anchor D domain-containing protein [Geovibrio thiophilus]